VDVAAAEPDPPVVPDAAAVVVVEDFGELWSHAGHLHADSDAKSAKRAAPATIRRPMKSSR
jgi:hypothetical protein